MDDYIYDWDGYFSLDRLVIEVATLNELSSEQEQFLTMILEQSLYAQLTGCVSITKYEYMIFDYCHSANLGYIPF